MNHFFININFEFKKNSTHAKYVIRTSNFLLQLYWSKHGLLGTPVSCFNVFNPTTNNFIRVVFYRYSQFLISSNK